MILYWRQLVLQQVQTLLERMVFSSYDLKTSIVEKLKVLQPFCIIDLIVLSNFPDMTAGLYPGQILSPPSKAVNVFDLTSKHKGMSPEGSEISSAKERAARITLCVVLTMVIVTAISLLVAEAFGLQWTLCSKPNNKTSQETWYQWPWNWKHNGHSLTVSESYQERWNTLSLPEKRKELFRATLGEVDLYDVYDISKDTHSMDTN